MKPLVSFMLGILLTICTQAPYQRFGSGQAFAAEVPWEDQLREMDYHIFHIASLNAMNAMNLTRDQIRKLQALARKVEQSGARPPAMRGSLCEGLAGVRETYRELTQTLLQGKEIPQELKTKVTQARTKEAQVIRATLITPQPGPPSQCFRCHCVPDKSRTLEPTISLEDASFVGKKMSLGADRKDQDLAHVHGLLGSQGIQTVTKLAPEVDALLTDAQKQIMQDFACCLIPPAELSDPVRAGQAEASEGALQLLRRARTVPASNWDMARTKTIARLKQMYVTRQPELTESDLRSIEAKLTDLFDRTRKMSDAEFELNKDALCVELKMKPPSSNSPQSFKAGFFLLMPGSHEIYAALLKRSESQ